MNKQIKHSIDAALNAKAEAGAKKPDASSEISAAAAIDTLADIAKRSINLFEIYTERVKSDDGYQVMDPRTVASTFQEFFQKAAINRDRWSSSNANFGPIWGCSGNARQPAFFQILRSSRSSSRRSKTSGSRTNSGYKIRSLTMQSNGICCGRDFLSRPFMPSMASIHTPSTRQNSLHASLSVRCHPLTLS